MASVIIRNKAKNRLAKILEQSFFDYGQTTMLRFLSELERIEKRLSEQHRPRRQEVIISTIWDLRMSPERLVKEFL